MFARLAIAAPSGPDVVAPVAGADAAKALVQNDLVRPLTVKEQERGKFSRARLPASERRVRILDEHPQRDALGAAFYTFAVDARHGFIDDDAGWKLAAVTGCVYLERDEILVKVGERHRPAAFMLGKNLKPVAETSCKPATATADAR